MPLKERNIFRLQNLVNVTLSIEVALHNNEICFPTAHNATPYHNTPTSKSVPLNETVISKTFPSSSKNSNSTVMMTKVKLILLMRPCIIMHQYCRPMPLKERNIFRLQNLVNVTLSIEVALHNNEICFPTAHNATPYHNTPTSKSVPLNETVISKTFPSSSKNSNSTVMMTKVKLILLIRE